MASRAIRGTDAKRSTVVEELGAPRIQQPGSWVPDVRRLGPGTIDLDDPESLALLLAREGRFTVTRTSAEIAIRTR